jgi:hypothetical protein
VAPIGPDRFGSVAALRAWTDGSLRGPWSSSISMRSEGERRVTVILLIRPSVLGRASGQFPRPAVLEASTSPDGRRFGSGSPILVPPEKQLLALGAAASRS